MRTVEASEPAGEHQGFPVWTAHCSDGGNWTIVITNDGTAAVLDADERRLVGTTSGPQEGRTMTMSKLSVAASVLAMLAACGEKRRRPTRPRRSAIPIRAATV